MSDVLKIVVIGDSHTGKSALTVRHKSDTFAANYDLTIGIDFVSKNVIIDDEKIVEKGLPREKGDKSMLVQIWDTAGSERFRAITSAYYRGSHIFLIVYDVTNKKSFDNVSYWFDQTKKSGQMDSIIVLAGNKSDDENNRIISYDEGFEKATSYGCVFFETSAKNGSNVNLLFEHCIRAAYNKTKSIDSADTLKIPDKYRNCNICSC